MAETIKIPLVQYNSNQDLLIALESLIDLYKGNFFKHQQIPLGLFSAKSLGVLEVISKYLVENHSLSFSEASRMINRDKRTIWTAYHESKRKHSEPFQLDMGDVLIPLEIFADRNLSPLESLVSFLKEKQNMSIKEISKALGKDYQTIWVSYTRGKTKKVPNV